MVRTDWSVHFSGNDLEFEKDFERVFDYFVTFVTMNGNFGPLSFEQALIEFDPADVAKHLAEFMWTRDPPLQVNSLNDVVLFRLVDLERSLRFVRGDLASRGGTTGFMGLKDTKLHEVSVSIAWRCVRFNFIAPEPLRELLWKLAHSHPNFSCDREHDEEASSSFYHYPINFHTQVLWDARRSVPGYGFSIHAQQLKETSHFTLEKLMDWTMELQEEIEGFRTD